MEELEQEKLPHLLELKYHAINRRGREIREALQE
jgi:hypothetical protein